MYIPVLNPVDNKTHLSPKQAERLVYMGHASYVVADDGSKQLRYLERYESMRIRADMDVAYELAVYDRVVNVERGGKIQGEWHPRRSGSGMVGSPANRSQQFEMTLDWVVKERTK